MTWAEQDWERLTDYVDVSLCEATSILSDYGRPRSLKLLPGGKANSNYRVSFGEEPSVVLRIYERDKYALAREARLLQLLAEKSPGLPAPRLLSTTTTSDGKPVGIFEFLEGEHSSDVLGADGAPAAAALGDALGATLAQLQRVEFHEIGLFAPDLSFKRRFDNVANSFVDLIEWSLREGRARKRLGDDLRSKLTASLNRAAMRLESLDGRYSLVHGDYKFSNILVAKTADGWRVSGLLDWEFACSFTPLLDVAILMRHRETFPEQFITSFESAYSELAWLPDDWKQVTRVIDLMNLVGFLNASGDRPRLYADVTTLIEQTLRHDL